MRNKANFQPSHVTDKSFMSNELWCIVHATDLDKTKPIDPQRAGKTIAYTGGLDAGTHHTGKARNKANLSFADWGQTYVGMAHAGRSAWGQLYKQIQLGRQIVRNKANFRPSHVTDKSFMGRELWCIVHATDLGKTKPIRGESPATEPEDVRRGSCTNKAN